MIKIYDNNDKNIYIGKILCEIMYRFLVCICVYLYAHKMNYEMVGWVIHTIMCSDGCRLLSRDIRSRLKVYLSASREIVVEIPVE